MHRFLKIAVVLWAWGCWAWVAWSHQWAWLAASFVPYLAFATWGDRLRKR